MRNKSARTAQQPAAEPGDGSSAPAVAEDESSLVCPNCGRRNTLVFLDDFVACAACGHSSAGLRSCT